MRFTMTWDGMNTHRKNDWGERGVNSIFHLRFFWVGVFWYHRPREGKVTRTRAAGPPGAGRERRFTSLGSIHRR